MENAINFLKALSGLRSPFLDTLIQLVTRLGEELIIFGVICLFYWCISKDVAYRLGFTFFSSAIAVQGLKITFCIPRPWVIDPTFEPVKSAIKAATGYSFPSGHTQSAASLYGTTAFTLKNKPLKVLSVFTVLAVGFSRMYLGVHTYFDVIAALAVTFAIAFLICRFSDVITNDKNTFIVMLVLSAVSLLLALYAFILMSIGHCDPSQTDGCFKTGGAGLAFAIGYYLERKYIRFDPRAGAIWFQAVKLAAGILGTLFFKSVVKLILPDMYIFDFIRYFITIFWVSFLFPLIFSKVVRTLDSKNNTCS